MEATGFKSTLLRSFALIKGEKDLKHFVIGQCVTFTIAILITTAISTAILAAVKSLPTELEFLHLLENVNVVTVMALLVWVHEFSHLAMFRRFGTSVIQIILPPIGGIAASGRKVSAYQSMLVALAGPMTGIVAFPLVVIGMATNDNLLFGIALFWAGINLINLLPIYPLDGSWILKNALTAWVSPKTAGHIVKFVTFLAAGALYLLVPDRLMLILIVVIVVLLAIADRTSEAVFQKFAKTMGEKDSQKTRVTKKQAVEGIAMYIALIGILLMPLLHALDRLLF